MTPPKPLERMTVAELIAYLVRQPPDVPALALMQGRLGRPESDEDRIYRAHRRGDL